MRPNYWTIDEKAGCYRGSFPMPWLSENFFMANEDEFHQAAGGINVTKSSVKG